MTSSYKRLGDQIQLKKEKNINLTTTKLLGINIDKFFMPSVANVIGTDLTNYKIVKENQFACNRMHVGRDYRIPIALSNEKNDFIVSPAYEVFEIIEPKYLLPEYLMMWFKRSEFDRNVWFHTDADVRGGLPWDAFANLKLPIPSPEKQQQLVNEYHTLQKRIDLNNKMIAKLEETSQAIYKQWFVDDIPPDMTFLNEYIETNPKLEIRKGQLASYVEMANLSEKSMCINGKIEREFQGGSKFQNNDTLLARITPCLENGKTAFVNILKENEISAGSTEFIVMRAKSKISPYWVYCLAKDENFRAYAISSMIGSSGRQRVHESYLEKYKLPKIDLDKMKIFHKSSKPIFDTINLKSSENQKLKELKELLLGKMAKGS
jgi:type I restriction enzyme S subunit